MDPAPQPESLGDFLIETVLGRGGSGVVYAAKWGPRRVALKVLHPGFVGTGKERAQFMTEAQRLQAIQHPSVVKVLAVGQLPDGRPYLAMELLDGETLATVIARGALPIDRALHLFGEMCNAVAALHEQGLIHRDLKPENVFIVEGRHAVLLDFGIAKELSAPASTTTQEGAVRGTPAYMAPERFFGQPASIATDVYELAVILYAMLSGKLPWSDPVDPEARLSPQALVGHAHVPEALDIEVRRALSTRAQNRPSSAAALLSAVRAAASGSATAGPPLATARMRPGPSQPPPQSQAAAPPSPVADVPVQQPAPLAWAPTEAAVDTAKRKKRRWPFALIGAAAAIGGGVLAFLLLRGEDTRAIQAHGSGSSGSASHTIVKSDSNDPWGDPAPEGPMPDIPLVEPQLTAETYRAEAAAGVQRLPPDTRLIFTAQIGELRDHEQMSRMLDKLAKHPKVAVLAGVLPPCIRALVAKSEWLAFGAQSLDESGHAALVVRGRWRRADVDKCLGDSVKKLQLQDGSRIMRLTDYWLDFIDEHTAYVTNRIDLGAEAVHSLVRHGAGPQAHTLQLVAKLPVDRTISFVDDGATRDDWEMLSLPKGTDIYGWMRADKAGLVMDLMADPHDLAAAKKASAAGKKEIGEVFADASDSVGKLDVVREGTVVHLRGTLSSLMLGIIDMALPSL